MTIDEAIKHCKEKAEELNHEVEIWVHCPNDPNKEKDLKDFENCKKCAEEHRQLAEWLKELKRLRNQTRWIPVSERLPDIDGEEYLVYRKTDTFVKRPFRIDIARWYSDDTENNGFNTYSEVIAWMPLPEPYKEQKQKKEEPITLTDEQITEMWESGYISDKEEYKDGND